MLLLKKQMHMIHNIQVNILAPLDRDFVAL